MSIQRPVISIVVGVSSYYISRRYLSRRYISRRDISRRFSSKAVNYIVVGLSSYYISRRFSFKALNYIVVGVSSYYISRRFSFKAVNEFESNDKNVPRGGDNTPSPSLIRRILENQDLKFAIASVMLVHCLNNFQDELVKLISEASMYTHLSKSSGKCAKLIHKFATENEIYETTKKLRETLIKHNLTFEDKVEFIKIKLAHILKMKKYANKKIIILLIIGIILSCCLSGIIGLSAILEALRRLLIEGKISEALYNELVDEALEKYGPVQTAKLLNCTSWMC
jgi:hypothetical protein